jgi:hypothetical protein
VWEKVEHQIDLLLQLPNAKTNKTKKPKKPNRFWKRKKEIFRKV